MNKIVLVITFLYENFFIAYLSYKHLLTEIKTKQFYINKVQSEKRMLGNFIEQFRSCGDDNIQKIVIMFLLFYGCLRRNTYKLCTLYSFNSLH